MTIHHLTQVDTVCPMLFADSYTFAIVDPVKGVFYGTHTVYPTLDTSPDHWDGGEALMEAVGGVMARGFEVIDTGGAFADAVDRHGDTWHIQVTLYDEDADTEVFPTFVVPEQADGVVIVLDHYRETLEPVA